MKIWKVLITGYFQKFVPIDSSVLDLGCGYGEFIRQITCAKKFAMDLNPDAPKYLGPDIQPLIQDCSKPWPFADNTLDIIFTSNFFEHLRDKEALGLTLDQAYRCLKPAGKLIAMGPNIRYLSGAYWDFWDHYLPLTEKSLGEALETRNFHLLLSHAKFLPYTMANGPQYPLFFLRAYLFLTFAWHFFGKQFLVVAVK